MWAYRLKTAKKAKIVPSLSLPRYQCENYHIIFTSLHCSTFLVTSRFTLRWYTLYVLVEPDPERGFHFIFLVDNSTISFERWLNSGNIKENKTPLTLVFKALIIFSKHRPPLNPVLIEILNSQPVNLSEKSRLSPLLEKKRPFISCSVRILKWINEVQFSRGTVEKKIGWRKELQ